VIEPESLRQAIQVEAEAMVSNYEFRNSGI
jgi:hypothetical protein